MRQRTFGDDMKPEAGGKSEALLNEAMLRSGLAIPCAPEEVAIVEAEQNEATAASVLLAEGSVSLRAEPSGAQTAALPLHGPAASRERQMGSDGKPNALMHPASGGTPAVVKEGSIPSGSASPLQNEAGQGNAAPSGADSIEPASASSLGIPDEPEKPLFWGHEAEVVRYAVDLKGYSDVLLSRLAAAMEELHEVKEHSSGQSDALLVAESALAALRAENERMRKALDKLADDIAKWNDCALRPDEWKLAEWERIARAALSGENKT